VKLAPITLPLVILGMTARPLAAQAAQATEWPAYGNVGGARFSPAAQITPANVGRLQLAWIYRTGDYHRSRGRFEANPIVVDGTLYLSTPLGRVVALEPATGAERWQSDQRIDLTGDYGDLANRGVATWLDAASPAGALCRRIIYLATVDARLIALDAANGRRCEGFGEGGSIELAKDLRHAPAWQGEYGVTSPPTVVGDIVVVGSAIADNQRTDAPEGVVRAFDARTGRLRWSFDPIPRSPVSPVWNTWRDSSGATTGAANAWTVFAADPALGLVYVPVGSASPDFYGGRRLGQNLYANSLVALEVKTGRVAWYFQAVHHDLWDYDIPAQPALFTWRKGGATMPAVAVATKMGHLFILDRRNGRPLVPVEERPVPRSDVPGEEAWPTQPFPPPAYRLVPEQLPPEVFANTDRGREACRAAVRDLRYEGIFTPQSVRGTINFPGHIGGMNWSGVAVDEARGLVIAPINSFAMVVRLIPRDSLAAERSRSHGEEISRQRGTPYGMIRTALWPPGALPCTPPPWGVLAALDLATDSVRWRVPLGETPGQAGNPEAAAWGTIGLGGATVTGSGLVFTAGTLDGHLRAFDEGTGALLWSTPLPAGGHALPTTYVANGRQYVVIAAGGHDRLNTPLGDYVLAYALPSVGSAPADTTDRVSPGAYAGEMRVGGARVGLDVTLAAIGDSLALTAAGTDSIAVTPGAAARRSGRSAQLDIPFDYAAKHCSGVIHALVTPWNRGNLLEGDASVSGTCGGGVTEQGSVALRRRSR
jgi:quinoprotein glucose dehydrogenase